MFTICASSYANIFISNFEAKQTYSYIIEVSLLYLRHIDDMLMIWKGTKAKLKTLIKDLNETHKSIKFDFQISPRKIAFLDAMFCTKTKITTSKQLSITNKLRYHTFMTSKKNV